MRVLLVAGARPNFIKVAPILWELRKTKHEAVLVHTGQHYDFEMSRAFFENLEIGEPDYHLGVGSGTHAQQTARCMEAFEPVLEEVGPDWVVVVGDVNSTLACALVTAKLRDTLGCQLAHVEAGLRSRDSSMPEEVNRVLTDRLADLCLTPSPDADENLRSEGIAEERIAFVGNVMIDSLFRKLPEARASRFLHHHGLRPGQFAVATLHRPSNVDEPMRLRTLLLAFGKISKAMPVVLPLHPRTADRVREFGFEELCRALVLLPPTVYAQMLALVAEAAVVLTDSGGIQEETTVLGVPCVTLRETTERPVTVTHGTNVMVAWPPTLSGVAEAATQARKRAVQVHKPQIEGWDGLAAARICEVLGRPKERLARDGEDRGDGVAAEWALAGTPATRR